MTDLISSARLLDLLLTAAETPGTRGAIAVVRASEDRAFRARSTSTAELLEIYERRLRMGRLDSVAGGREFVEALQGLRDSAVLMVVVESFAGAASVWLSVDIDSVVGAISFPAAPDRVTK